ncbi:hypothetical protein WICANDRAFT_83965 [Wickerhamomyces anomalus NRRL Y-366-8]|uniref:holo-[acyl-carrier-protein] synthase n=1 Tax=Wickerhamomyces anomalus (strain ATCC 58044 / CBS 1984 / NCYC 433 / NRRL Y-366-8) TaxID=683960 RepID=A0A1E3P3A9_WICAA|nr:uncharacterized protein WICANDRAFT_83965 [Wickerhamomyces anomalus NRRL Y-366-8]ODQ59966.1 hypothetical protein WICANDRAFT_83965 [Wickerhamomyces anomalus NRRL Y-366-8]
MSNQQGYTSMVISYQSEEVGIDLASISDIEKFGNGYLTHFKDIFHPDEYDFLESVHDAKELECLFTEYWALKESYTKKLGIGLNGELGAYNFQNVAKLSKPTINSIDSSSFDSSSIDSSSFDSSSIDSNSFDLKPNSHWSDSTKLFINNTHIQPLDIHLTMLNNDIVLSVCGDQIPNTPSLIKIPLSLITKFFS